MHPRRFFGELCVEKNFASDTDVKNALREQEELKRDGQPHKMIGLIMLDTGVLTTTQLIEILQEMDKRSKLMEA